MPVPTPRTIHQPTESSCLDIPDQVVLHQQPQSIADESIEDNIPEDWKDNGEIVIKHLQPATCQITTNLQESVKPWTQPIPEVSEEEISETEETEMIYLQNNNNCTQKQG